MYDTNDYINIYNVTNTDFSIKRCEILSEYLEDNNKKPKSILDLACGTGVFLDLMQKKFNAKDCVGLDLSKEMYKFAKWSIKNDNINFVLGDMSDFDLKRRFDLISCNYDAINHLLKFSDWKKMFKKAFKHLENGGVFTFDFNTLYCFNLKKYHNSTYYSEYENFNHISQCNYKNGVFTFDDTIYVKNKNGTYKMLKEHVDETSFEVNKIINALKEIGFSNVKCCDENYKQTKSKTEKRLYIICEK